jgi:hypothetical protein
MAAITEPYEKINKIIFIKILLDLTRINNQVSETALFSQNLTCI